jgi:predicted histidine transporter YuiF (NhaC family)
MPFVEGPKYILYTFLALIGIVILFCLFLTTYSTQRSYRNKKIYDQSSHEAANKQSSEMKDEEGNIIRYGFMGDRIKIKPD